MGLTDTQKKKFDYSRVVIWIARESAKRSHGLLRFSRKAYQADIEGGNLDAWVLDKGEDPPLF